MSRVLGEGLINITPETVGFRPQLMAKLKAALTGVKGEVPITAQTAKLDAAIATSKAKIAALKEAVGKMQLKADTSGYFAQIAAAKAKAAELAAKTSSLKLDADDTAFIAKIAGLQRQAAHLAASMEYMDADVDIRAASTKILAITAQIKYLQSQAANLHVEADTARMNAQLLAERANIAALQDQARKITFAANFTKLNAQLTAEEARLEELTRTREANVKVDVDTSALAKAKALLAGLFGGGGKGGGGPGGVGGGGYFFGLGIFGPALRGITGNITLLHVALDALLEAFIAVGTAAAAATVGIAAMAPAAKDIATQLKAVDTVNEALHASIPSLSLQFDELAKSLAPQVVEAYGGALHILGQNTGALSGTAHQFATGIDDVVAKLDLWARNQNQLGGILQAGMGFLSQFASILGHLGEAILGLLKSNPGTAQFLLTIIDGFAKILDWASKLPAPLLQVALLMASVHTWGNVMAGTLSKLPGLFGKVGKGLVGLLSGISGGLVIAAIALAVQIGRAWNTSSAQVAGAIGAIDKALASMSASDAFFAIPAAIGALNNQLKLTNTRTVLQGWTGLNDIWQRSGDKLKVLGSDLKGIVTGSTVSELKSFASFFGDLFTSNAGQKEAALQVQQDMANLNAEINKLLGSQRNLDGETGILIRKGYSFSQALALMNLAGVNVNDKLAVMDQKVKNLIDGYQAMSVRGTILANSVNAITFATGLQESKVNDLNSAWDTFISTVTGSESGFAGVENDIAGLFAAAAQGGAHLTDSNGRVSDSFGKLTGSAGKTAASFTGLDTTSLSLQQTFNQSLTGANSMLDALTAQAAAAGLGQKGTDLLTQATQDLVVQLLPAAKGSKTLTAELYALAQRGGYQGADSFQALSKWVSKTKDPMKNLQGVVQTFTVASAGLTDDVKNLSVALGTTLTGAMSQAVFLASGGQTAFTNFAKAVLTSGGDLGKMKGPAATLIDQLLKMTGNTKDAEKEFDAFAMGALHLTKAQADALWKSVAGGSQTVSQATSKIASAFTRQKDAADVARLGIGLLTGSIELNGAKSSQTRDARNKLVADMVKAGVNAATAKRDVDGYTSAVAKNGVNSDQARQARNKLITDLLNASKNAAQGQRDLNDFTQKVKETGDKSDATRKARERLIQDLINSGLSAKDAKALVDGLQKSIDNLHGKVVDVGVKATAQGTLNAIAHLPGQSPTSGALVFTGHAAGGKITGGTPGKDSVLGMLMPGEVVVPTRMVQAGAVDHLRGKLPGFAGGGLVPGIGRPQDWAASTEGAWGAEVAKLWAQAADKQFQAAAQMAALGGPAGGATGSRLANALEGYRYLLANVFGGARIAAAGAVASIDGESSWNPFAVGTGGRGLIGWTPPSTISNADFAGGMRTQLPAIIRFITTSGDWGVIGRMKGATSVTQAAYEWGQGVERYGIPDVHPAGIALGEQVAGISSGLAANSVYGSSGHLTYAGGGLVGYANGGLVPGYAGGGLAAGQAAERGAYSKLAAATWAALARPNTNVWLRNHETSVRNELGTLAKRQAAEQAAYALLSGRGLTRRNLSKFATKVREELRTGHDKYLNTAEPALTGRLDAALGALLGAAASGLPAPPHHRAGHPAPPHHPAGSIGGATLLASGLTRAQYQAGLQDVRGLSASAVRSNPHLRHIWHLLHLQHLADLGMAAGGLVPSFDRGGTLAPGPNLVWNHTGRPEHLTPDGGGNITIVFENRGVIGSQPELQNWLVTSIREAARVKGGGNVQRAFGRNLW